MSQELPFSPTDYSITAEGNFALARVRPGLPPCERCDGSGRVTVVVDNVTTVGRCRCRMLHDRVELFNRARIPARHANSTFRSFKRENSAQETAYDAVKSWLRTYRPGKLNRGLLLYGDVGRGKTHLLIAVLRELVFRHGVPVRFVEFTHLLWELREGFEKDQGEEVIIRPLTNVDVLAIDDLGQSRRTEWEKAIVDVLVTRRHNQLKTLLVTTNYAPGPSKGFAETNLSIPENKQALVDRVPERVYSRLNEQCTFIPVFGDDYRIKMRNLAPSHDAD